MGIRVVQRAMAPPSPLQYNPAQTGSATSLGGRKTQARNPSRISILGRQTSEAQPSPEKTINGSVGSTHSTPKHIGNEQGSSDNEVRKLKRKLT